MCGNEVLRRIGVANVLAWAGDLAFIDSSIFRIITDTVISSAV